MNGDWEASVRSFLKSVLKEAMHEVLAERSSPRAESAGPPDRETADRPDRLLLRPREVAELLGISEPTLHRWTHSGKVPYVKIGRLVRYSAATLQEWICDAEASQSVSKAARREEQTERRKRPRSKAKASMGKSGVSRAPSLSGRTTHRSPKRPVDSRSGSRKRQPASEEQRDLSPFAVLLQEIGIDRATLPPMTNGELMRIAEVDMPTFYRWMHLGGELPAEARRKLQEHFAAGSSKI